MKLPSRVGAFEIAGDEVRLAVVQTGGALPTLLEYHANTFSYATDEERAEAFVAAIKHMVAQVKAHPALYVLCVKSQSMVVRNLTVPFRGHTRVAAAVPIELEPNLAFPIDDLIIDHAVTKEVPGETAVLAVAVKQSALEDLVSEFGAAGVQIEGINLDVAGLATLWLAGQRKPAGLHAQLHIRDDGAILCVVHNRRLIYFRHLGHPAERVLAGARDVSRDVRNTLRAFGTSWQTDESVADLTVTGVDLDPVLREEFEDGLNVPVLYSELGSSVRGADKALARFRGSADIAPGEAGTVGHLANNRWEAAAGVAAATGGGGILFEFLKGPLAPQHPFTVLRGRLLATAAMLLVTLAGMAGYCTAQYQNNVAEIDRVGEQIWTIYTETFPGAQNARPEDDSGGTKSMALLETAQKEAEEASARLSAETLARPPLLDIIKELSDKFPADKVVLSQVQIRDTRGSSQSLYVEGEIMDNAAFDEALEKLKQSTVLHVDDDPVLATRDGKTSFRLQATI